MLIWCKSDDIPNKAIGHGIHWTGSFQQLYALCGSYLVAEWRFSLGGWPIWNLASEIMSSPNYSIMVSTPPFTTEIYSRESRRLVRSCSMALSRCLGTVRDVWPKYLNEAPHNRPTGYPYGHMVSYMASHMASHMAIFFMFHTSSHIYSVPFCFHCMSQV